MAALTDEEVAEYKEAFLVFDTRDAATVADMAAVMRSLGQDPAGLDLLGLDAEATFDFRQFLDILGRACRAAEEADLRDAFGLFDRDGSGRVPASDLGALARALGRVGEPEVRAGSVDFATARAWLLRLPEVDQDDEAIQAFGGFDPTGCGTISKAEARHVMTALSPPVTDDEMDNLIESADIRGDGRVDYRELWRMATRTSGAFT